MLGSIIRYQLDCDGLPIHFEAVNQNARILNLGESIELALDRKDLLVIQQ